jgi:hypothetical protein
MALQTEVDCQDLSSVVTVWISEVIVASAVTEEMDCDPSSCISEEKAMARPTSKKGLCAATSFCDLLLLQQINQLVMTGMYGSDLKQKR